MTEAMLGSGTVRIGVMRLQLGPFASERTLLGALGDALVRGGLVAETSTSSPPTPASCSSPNASSATPPSSCACSASSW